MTFKLQCSLALSALLLWSGSIDARDKVRVKVVKSIEVFPRSFSVENALAGKQEWTPADLDTFQREVTLHPSRGKGTRFGILLKHDDWSFSEIPVDHFKIKSMKDDKGESLDGLLSGVTVQPILPRGEKIALVDVFTKFLPSPGATKVTLEGSATVKVLRERKQTATEPILIHPEMGKVPLKLGLREFTLRWTGTSTKHPVLALEYKGNLDFINEIQFQTTEGQVIQHHKSGSSSAGDGKRIIRESRSYMLMANPGTLVLAVDLWTDPAEKTVPFKIEFDLNMAAEKKTDLKKPGDPE